MFNPSSEYANGIINPKKDRLKQHQASINHENVQKKYTSDHRDVKENFLKYTLWYIESQKI